MYCIYISGSTFLQPSEPSVQQRGRTTSAVTSCTNDWIHHMSRTQLSCLPLCGNGLATWQVRFGPAWFWTRGSCGPHPWCFLLLTYIQAPNDLQSACSRLLGLAHFCESCSWVALPCPFFIPSKEGEGNVRQLTQVDLLTAQCLRLLDSAPVLPMRWNTPQPSHRRPRPRPGHVQCPGRACGADRISKC